MLKTCPHCSLLTFSKAGTSMNKEVAHDQKLDLGCVQRRGKGLFLRNQTRMRDDET